MLDAQDSTDDAVIYTDKMEEAKSLVEQYGEEKIYVVEAAGEYYGENKYFDTHAKCLSIVDGEFYLKVKGKDAVKVA